MITEKNNGFYCDCGFSWRRGMSGSHNCEDRLRAKLTDLAVQLANAESKCRELAAENAGLKNFIINDCHVAHIEPETFYEEEVTRYVSADGYEPETPATDAFLAEVRAQVWIEGNEPAEFGRYWVRYETDVGPQYCSAKFMEHNFCAGSNTNIHKIWLADHSRSINSLRGVTHYTKLPDSLEGAAQ